MRRLLVFLGMIAAGLAAVLLLADDPLGGDQSGGGPLTGRAGTDGDAVAIASDAENGDIRVVIGVTDFPVTRVVEMPSGETRERVAYNVHVAEARLGEDGRWTLQEPEITLLEPVSGDWRGELSSEVGYIEAGGTVPGSVQLQTLTADAFLLEGDVQGRFATNGGDAHLRAESLDVRGRVVTAPGEVRWWRDDLALDGVDMVLDDLAGTLLFARDAVLTTDGSAGPAGAVTSPTGMLWNLPAESGGRGHGELYGPVTGTGDDGSSFRAERLLADADDNAFTLLGEASAQRPGAWSARGTQLTVAPGSGGALTLVHGVDTRFDLTGPGREGWLQSPALHREGDALVSSVPVQFGLGSLHGRGADLRWDQVLGQVECSAQVVLEIEQGPLAGATLDAPGGMTITALAGPDDLLTSAFGELRGPVSGTFVDGRAFSARTLELDGPSQGLVLHGDAHATQADGSSLDADRIQLLVDERGSLTDGAARGDVIWRGPPDASSRLAFRAEQLDAVGSVISSPDQVTAHQAGWSLAGDGLRFDTATGRIELQSRSTIAFETGGLVTRRMDSAGGLEWVLPEDRSLGAAAGRGRLRGGVTGSLEDGRTVSAETAHVEGADREVRLVGRARVERASSTPGEEPRWIEGEELSVRAADSGRAAWSEQEIRFGLGDLSGSSHGFRYDELGGLLSLHADATLRVEGSDGRQRFALASEGRQEWVLPGKDGDPMLDVRGEAWDGVTAVDDSGARFLTDHLMVDGPSRTITLIGPSQVEQYAVGRTVELSARERITTERDVNGGLVLLQADGDVEGHVDSPGESLAFHAQHFTADRAAGALVFDGPSRVERDAGGSRSSLDGEAGSRLVALVDEDTGIQSVAGSGRFTIGAGAFTALSDSLDWDVPSDHLVLDGNCRMLSLMGWVDADRIELWPRARRSFIPVPAVVLDGSP
jgi:hypothetical protein